MSLSNSSKEFLFLLLAILIGALAGIGTLGFLALIKVEQWGFWPGQGHFLDQVLAAPWWLRVLIPTLGGLVVGPVIAFWAQEARGPGVPEVIESAALQEGRISPKKALLKAGVTSLTIATGGSVGREGPGIGIGAAIGSAMTRLFSFSTGKGRICLACGTAAAFAATFNTPISGALFTIEVILADMEIVYLGHIVIAAIVAVLISRQFMGDFPTFHISAFVYHSNVELLLYLGMGLLAGLIAIAFTYSVYTTDGLFRRLPLPEWSKPALGGLGLGLLALATPHILGVGYATINMSLAGKFVLASAAFLLLMKFLATVLCLGSGMSGGIMGPNLFLGAMLGTVLSLAANHFFPGLHLVPTDYALVGMGALVSGTTLGPITATLIIFELSDSHAVIVPTMVSCIASFMVVKAFYGYSTYEMKLVRRGVRIFQGRATHLLETMKVQDYMSKKMELIHDDMPVQEIMRRAEKSTHPFFVVLDEKCKLSGVLTLLDLRQVLAHQEEGVAAMTAKNLKTSEVITVHPEDDLETAFHLLENKEFSSLPVVLPQADKVVVGVLKMEDALTAYNQRLLKEQRQRYPLARAASRRKKSTR